MGGSNTSHIMTLVNSIIGVSILAMPFCYKQCGIILASLILIFSNWMTRLSCHYLLKSAIMTRRRTYELLAFHALGGSGKTAVELSIILLMIGTCIAFFVVMGDLGPAILGPILQVEYSAALRPAVLIGLAVFVVLPLGLLRNVDSLSSICTASFLFYLLLVIKVFIESMDNLFSSTWIDEAQYWRPAGILQCLPIFSMALSCQTQLLEIFDSVQASTLDKMNSVVKSAVNLCTALYMAVGFLGYIAYYRQSFTGNLMMSFSASHFSEFIKMGFVLSVAVTFPLVVFPCRTSLHSLLFKKVHMPHYELVTGGGNHIPEAQFKCITFFIITLSLIVGLLAPNIEIVLGLLGSTIGVIICVLCPPFIFIWISSKATTEKVLAQAMCAFGLFIMIMGTYANLYLSGASTDAKQPQNWKTIEANVMEVPVGEAFKELNEKNAMNVIEQNAVQKLPNQDLNNKLIKSEGKKPEMIKVNEEVAVQVPGKKEEDDKRIEPPIPQDPEAFKALPNIENQPQQKDTIDSNPVVNINEESNKLNNSKPISVNKESKILKKEETQKKMRRDSNIVKNEERMKIVPKAGKRDKVTGSAVHRKGEAKIEKIDNEKKLDTVVRQAPLNELQKLANEQPPLPLLVKAQSNSEIKEQLLKNPAENKIVEREKRDLEYVTNMVKEDAVKISEKEVVDAKKEIPELPIRENDSSNSFLKKVAENTGTGEVCKKNNTLSAEIEKKGTAELSKELSKNVVSDVPVLLETNSKVNIQKLADLPANLKEDNATVDKKGNVIIESSKLINSDQVPPSVRDSKPEKVLEGKESLIISPSKLSVPDLLLQDRLYVDEKKPVITDLLKSLSRELKAMAKEPEGRKK